MLVLYILTFIDLGDIEDDPAVAIQNRSGFIFFLTALCFFMGINLSAGLFLPLKRVYLKDM